MQFDRLCIWDRHFSECSPGMPSPFPCVISLNLSFPIHKKGIAMVPALMWGSEDQAR